MWLTIPLSNQQCQKQFSPLVFSPLSSSGECPSFITRTRATRSRTRIAAMASKSCAASSFSSLTPTPHRALIHPDNSFLPCSIDSHGSSYSGSSGRRKLLFMSSISFLLPPHSWAETSDAAKLLAIRNSLRDVLSKAKAAGMLRLAFHDAGTYDKEYCSGGMNGSILYELGRPENAGLNKSIKILEKAKREIDKILEVSWADLIAVAGAEAIFLCGGPAISVKVGRLDVRKPDPEGKLPQETMDAPGLKSSFQRKGFCTQELVALSGAHTLGIKGFGNPNVFDNAYYKILLEKPWTSSGSMSSMIGLPSDHSLAEDDECLRWIKVYAGDEVNFFDDFGHAYVKLVDSAPNFTKVTAVIALWGWTSISLAFAAIFMFYRCSRLSWIAWGLTRSWCWIYFTIFV